jgi:hypothetical protein
MAKGRKTGGRKKGTPNKATAARQAEFAASGLTPLDFMLEVMRSEENDLAVRLDAAVKAAPYCHPRLAAIDSTHRGPDGGAVQVHYVITDKPMTADEWVASCVRPD